MACYLTVGVNQTIEARQLESEAALKRLEAQIAAGKITVKIGPQGAVAFQGWKDRDGLSDVCAFRVLSSKGSEILKRAVMRAETFAGRKVDQRTVVAGVHSHNGGKTWNKGH